MRMTVEIPDQLCRQAKAKAAMDGLKLKDMVASALRVYLVTPNPAGRGVAPAKTCPFPLIRGKGGPLLKSMSDRSLPPASSSADASSSGLLTSSPAQSGNSSWKGLS